MKSNKKHKPILILTALLFESKIILNNHNINIRPQKLTTYQLAESIYLIEVPIGFKFDSSILNREIEKISPKLIINFALHLHQLAGLFLQMQVLRKELILPL